MRFLIPLLLAPTFASADPCQIAEDAIAGWNAQIIETKDHAEAVATLMAVLKLTDPEAYEAAKAISKQPEFMIEGAQKSADSLLATAEQFAAECR